MRIHFGTSPAGDGGPAPDNRDDRVGDGPVGRHRDDRARDGRDRLDRGPRAAYVARLEVRRESLARVERRYATLSNLRLLVFALFLVSLWLVLGRPDWPMATALVAPGLFCALVVVHEVVAQRRERLRRAVAYYEVALARLEDRWVGVGPTGEGLAEATHPYAQDFDLFGPGSLFQRLSLARTRFGERTLASWLLAPAVPAEVVARQNAVHELRPDLDLREALALEGEELEKRGDPEAFLRWAEAGPALPGTPLRVGTALLAVGALVAFLGAVGWSWGWGPFLLVVMAQIVLRLRVQKRLTRGSAELEEAHGELQLLATVLRQFETRRFQGPWLARVGERLAGEGRPPSVWIRRLDRCFDAYEARRNSLFAPIAFVLLLDLLLGFYLDDWRRRVGSKARVWLQAVGDLEAISSLAGYAFERPDDVFPHLVPAPMPAGTPATTAAGDARPSVPFLRAEELGHPLLPADRCVRNSVALGGASALGDAAAVGAVAAVGRVSAAFDGAAAGGVVAPSLLIVSGSNMSGKSTFLRSLGISVVLAQAGAPVRATSFTLAPLRLGASIRVQDSIQDGVSHFYAEVRRLRQIVARTEEEETTGLLFLVDEILQGTNSHDRAIGVEAVMTTLVARGALGVITTHDLALTEMAARLGPAAENVHFEDQLVDGVMSFDYRLRPGVVTRSNALALMRAVGLDVGPVDTGA